MVGYLLHPSAWRVQLISLGAVGMALGSRSRPIHLLHYFVPGFMAYRDLVKAVETAYENLTRRVESFSCSLRLIPLDNQLHSVVGKMEPCSGRASDGTAM